MGSVARRIHRVQTVVRRTGILELVHHGVRSDTNRGWPTCHACRNQFNGHAPDLDAVEMVDEGPKHLVVLGKHHGAEDVIRVDWDWPKSEDDVSNAWRAMTFFCPGLGS
jgi:hypothetical protein